MKRMFFVLASLAALTGSAAAADLVEWGPETTAQDQFGVLLFEMPIDQFIALSPTTPALSDDRPINEYYLLRSSLRHRPTQ